MNDLEEMMLNTFYNKSRINTTAALEEAKQILKTIKGRDFKDDETKAFEESRYVVYTCSKTDLSFCFMIWAQLFKALLA